MERIKSLSLYIFLGLLAYMPLHIFISTWFGTSFGMLEFSKIFKDIVLVVGFTCVSIACWNKSNFKKLFRDKLIWLIAAYALLTLFMALIKPTDMDAEILGIVYNLRFFLFFIYGILLTYLFKPDWLLSNAIKIVLGVGVFVLAFGVVQYLWLPDNALQHVGYARENGVLPAFFIDDKPDLERAMSTLRDPNSFGSYVIILLTIALSYLISTKNNDLKKVLGGIVALSLMCLWYSFSRGAWIGAVIAVATLFAVKKFRSKELKLNKTIFISLAAITIFILGGFYLARDTYFVKNVVLHADESTVLEDPNELRLRFWRESVQAAVEQPLGYGPGTAGLASIRNEKQGTILNENYYLQILHEVGIVGFLIFVSVLFIVARRLYSISKDSKIALALLASFAGLAVTNFLVHTWSNEAIAYTWWGLAGLVILITSYKERSQPS